jgi:hypothetical protein
MPNSFPPEFELDEKTVKLSLSIVSLKDDSEAKRLTKPLSDDNPPFRYLINGERRDFRAVRPDLLPTLRKPATADSPGRTSRTHGIA